MIVHHQQIENDSDDLLHEQSIDNGDISGQRISECDRNLQQYAE